MPQGEKKVKKRRGKKKEKERKIKKKELKRRKETQRYGLKSKALRVSIMRVNW